MMDAPHTQSGCTKVGLSAKKSLIYVVDDDFDVLKSLRFLLETEGFEVRTFRGGSALLGSGLPQEADCLIVDYKMAGIDGLELARRLRDLDVKTPIILITDFANESILAKASSAGVRQILIKPDLGDNLVASVRGARRECP
jgi:FixJ family two-component response regulator